MDSPPRPLVSRRSGPLQGNLTVPGDKSISHRSVMFGGIAEGVTTVRGLLEGDDVLRTVAALRLLGAVIERRDDLWRIEGVGLDNLREPEDIIDMGNSGTSARLLIGLLSAKPFTSFITGDASLRKRPMGRVIEPLRNNGATFISRTKGRLPLAVVGAAWPMPLTYKLPVASAQVKSAILLAGLSAEGVTTVTEPIPTRDHTERMLRAFGARVDVTPADKEGDVIRIIGGPRLKGREIVVPADISSAAFPIVAALLKSGSQVTLRNVGLNPRRIGLLTTLKEMGADIVFHAMRDMGGEPVADLIVTGSALKGVEVPADRAPSMIDEFPILAMAAACAEGKTRMCGLGELRVKESDRLALVADGLTACGAAVEIEDDDLIVHGTGKPPKGGATVATAMDHRIAMSFLVLGLTTQEPVRIDDGAFIATSFPGFVAMMNGLGAEIVAETIA